MNKHLTLFLLMLVGSFAWAQEMVTGKVVDQKSGDPLPGVNVVVKNTARGTVTSSQGNFSLEASPEDVLVFSFIGYAPKEVKVGEESNFEVSMGQGVESLDEVVVIGYGSQKKEDITGAISIVGEEALDNRPNTQMSSLIQGKAAGVQVVSSSGKPSAGLNLRIRGTNSINASSEPLYVIDGVPTTDTRSLNPADIESISILKDASSAAIYGAQGANGVVLITTKRGKTEKPLFNFTSYLGFSEVWNTLQVLNAEQYRDLMTELGQNTDWTQYTQNTDWQNEIFDRGLSQNYQLSVSGKNDRTSYYVSGGYVQQEGAVRTAEMERYSFKVNLSQQLNNWLKVGTNVGYTDYSDVDVTDNLNVGSGGVLLGVLTTPPNIGIYNEDGTFTSNPFQNWENPYAATDGRIKSYRNQRLIGNLYAEATFLEDFTYKSSIGIDYSNATNNNFLDPYLTSYGRAFNGSSVFNTYLTNYYIIDNTVTYEKNLENQNFRVMVGSVAQQYKWENSSMETRNFASSEIITPSGGAEIISATADKSEKANASFISRVNYEFDDRYLLTANFRADGSSAFGPAERWGYFPSFSAGWVISQEGFMETVNFLANLKLRAGWGIVGNDQIGNYPYMGRVGTGGNYPIGGIVMPGTYPASIENEALKWEESEQLNVGLDFGVLNGRVQVSADAYIKNTNDLLLAAPLPRSTGFDNAVQNVGSLQNRGVELMLRSFNINKEKFTWTTDLNITFNRSEVIDLVGQELFSGSIPGRGEVSLVREGLPLGVFYGYVAGGVDPETGMMYYIDQNGESTFEPTADDRQIIGNANPDFTYGITNDLNYGAFGLTIFLQGSQGNDIFNATRIETEGMLGPQSQTAAVLDRWREVGDQTDIPRAVWGSTANSLISTRFVEDGSYMRIKALTFSYTVPNSLVERISIQNLRLYVTGENLLTFTNYSGFDPEVNAFGGSNTALGVDYGTYPQTRNIIFGLNLSF